MCNLSEGIAEEAWAEAWDKAWEQGVAQGMEQGVAQGMAQGLAQGLEQGEKNNMIEVIKKLWRLGAELQMIEAVSGWTEEQIMKVVQAEMN